MADRYNQDCDRSDNGVDCNEPRTYVNTTLNSTTIQTRHFALVDVEDVHGVRMVTCSEEHLYYSTGAGEWLPYSEYVADSPGVVVTRQDNTYPEAGTCWSTDGVRFLDGTRTAVIDCGTTTETVDAETGLLTSGSKPNPNNRIYITGTEVLSP